MMNVVFCTDDNYLMPCGITMISLLENNKNKNFVIHIVGLNLKQESKDLLIQNVRNYNNVEFKFYEISEDIFERYNLSLFNSRTLTMSAYSRLFLTDILPSTIDEVLYLDCDLIIAEDLSEIFNTELDNFALAGVLDISMCTDEVFSRLGYNSDFGYINSGVLLINLKYWRENNMIKTFMDFYKTKMDSIKYHDQDIINGAINKLMLLLPIKYNLNDYYYKRTRISSIYDDEINLAIRKPSIIHFTLSGKPWLRGCVHPEEDLFDRYKALSVWKNTPKNWGKTKLKHKIRHYKRLMLYNLNLRSRIYLTKRELIN